MGCFDKGFERKRRLFCFRTPYLCWVISLIAFAFFTSACEDSAGLSELSQELSEEGSAKDYDSDPTIEELRMEIEELKDPSIGDGTTVLPPLASATGIPTGPNGSNLVIMAIDGAEQVKYVVIDGNLSCDQAQNSYPDEWVSADEPIQVDVQTDGLKKMCVIGKNGSEIQQAATEYTWVQDSSAPTGFALTAPEAMVSTTVPVVSWQSSGGATSYNLTLATDASCLSVVKQYLSMEVNSKQMPPLATGQYYLCLWALDDAGNETAANNNGYGFLVDTSAPDTPTGLIDGGVYSTSSTVTFTWNAAADNGAAGVTSYELRVGTTSGGSDTYQADVGLTLSRSVTSLVSGVSYYAEVRSVDAAGNTSLWSTTSDGILVDTSVGSAPTSVITAADSAVGSDVRIDDDSIFYAVWSGAIDDESGIRDYILMAYSQASCGGMVTEYSGITDSYQSVSGSDGMSYSFKVKVFDNAGNEAISPCSDSMSIDTTPPPALDSFNGASGDLSGHINLALDFPVDTSDVVSVVIRRAAGATAPVDCSTGTSVKTLSSFTDTTWIDETGLPSSFFSYLACVYDNAGNLTFSNKAENIQAKVYIHTAFVTQGTFTGNLGGFTGADAKCQAAATAGSLTQTYKALLSTSSVNANARLTIKGAVVDTLGNTIATSKVDLWDGSLASAMNYDEYGNPGGGTTYTWSNTSYSGTSVSGYNCSGWTSSSSSFRGNVARRSVTNTQWSHYTSGYCHSSYHIYCISQFAYQNLQGFNGATGAALDGDIALTVDFPADTSNYQKVEIRRTDGASAPTDCVSGTVVKTYTAFDDATFTDATGGAGKIYSYRACTIDLENDLIGTLTAENVRAKGKYHLAFTTQNAVSANMGGLSGADTICQGFADAASLSGTFRAILSDDTTDASLRINIKGPVSNINGDTVAENHNDLWDSSLGTGGLRYDEHGVYTGNFYIWTGTVNGTGVKYPGRTCLNWSSTSAASATANSGYSGDARWIYERNSRGCTSTSYHIYCISQYVEPVLDGFSAVTGTGSDGDIDVTIDFPSDPSGYGRVEIRRLQYLDAPGIDCTSGTLVNTLTSFVDTTVTDIGDPATLYSYRACAFDQDGDLIGSLTDEATRSKGDYHLAFVTQGTYNGNLGGVVGADALCQTAANNASLAGNYGAILSDSVLDANKRIVIKYPVYNTNGHLIANDRADFWDQSLAYSGIRYNEIGVYNTGYVATGSTANGVATNTCGDWLVTTGNANYAYNGYTDSRWLYYSRSSCANSRHLYCITQVVHPKLVGFTATSETGNGEVGLAVTFPGDTSNYGSVEIRRLAGGDAPDTDCSSNGTIVETFTSYGDGSYTDLTGVQAGVFSYRACAFDTDGDLIDSLKVTDVRAGGAYHLIFTTSSSTLGNLGGLAGADAFCATAASNGGLSGSYAAVLSADGIDAINRITVTGPIYNTNSQIVADDKSELFSGTLQSTLGYDEYGNGRSVNAWTGSTNSGSNVAGRNCADWTSTTATSQYYGSSDRSTAAFYYYRNASCGTSYLAIYCISDEL